MTPSKIVEMNKNFNNVWLSGFKTMINIRKSTADNLTKSAEELINYQNNVLNNIASMFNNSHKKD